MPSYYREQKPEFEFARQYLDGCRKILEIGAGAGAFGASLSRVDYVGLELSESAAERARARGLKVSRESLEHHVAHRGARQYDAVCAFQVLEHVPNPRQFLHHAFAALRPGGIAIFSVPDDGSFTPLVRNNVLNMPLHHQTRWRKAVFEYLAHLFDVELVACEREKLADAHLDAYLNAIMSEAIDAVLGRQRRELDLLHDFLPVRMMRKAVTVWLRRGLAEPALRPDGESMTAVLRKL
jgi:SAM-dependent methyltransferase